MVRQIITVFPNGDAAGLQVKPGRGVDLRRFGHARIVRASEIIWDEDKQGWVIQIADAPGFDNFKGVRVTYRMAHKADELAGSVAIHRALDMMAACRKLSVTGDEVPDSPICFNDYEEAVQIEIAFLDAHRVAGRH